jgi:hypothetical protein
LINENIKYIQTEGSFLRNKTKNILGVSSDLSIFNVPSFTVIGAEKILTDTEIAIFNETAFNNQLETFKNDSLVDCYDGVSFSGGCFSSMTWNLVLEKNGEEIIDTPFYSSISTGDTPTLSNVLNSINNNYSNLGYRFNINDNELELTKPYGTSELNNVICLDLKNDSISCSGNCDTYCFTAFTFNFSAITSGSSNVFIIENTQTEKINITINFSDINELIVNDVEFFLEFYKFNNVNRTFNSTPILTTDVLNYQILDNGSITFELNPNDINLDGDYLIKLFFQHKPGTTILSRIGDKIQTPPTKYGESFNIYDSNSDYYFAALTKASEPIFSKATPFTDGTNTFRIITLIPEFDNQTQFIIPDSVNSINWVTLNGLTLTNGFDYTLTPSGETTILEFISSTFPTDIINLITSNSEFNDTLRINSFLITNQIASGTTNNEGSNIVYFNTDTNKYEFYLDLEPIENTSITLFLNGLTLAPEIDFYRSITNKKRIILEGDIVISDVLTLVYNVTPEFVDNVFSNPITINWYVETLPQLNNGVFTLELSTISDFSNIINSVNVNYIPNISNYSAELILTGGLGTELFYRVKNHKSYEVITGDKVETIMYSEIAPIIIRNNSLNSY